MEITELLEELEHNYEYLFYLLALDKNAGKVQLAHAKESIVSTKSAIISLFESEKDNKNRFLNHLEKIARLFDIDWTDGDFPIDELENKIKDKNG